MTVKALFRTREHRHKSCWERPVTFIAPSFIILVTLTLYPLAFTLYYAFQKWNLALGMAPQGFVGLENFARIIADPVFRGCTVVTFKFAIFAVSLEATLGVAIALLLNRPGRGWDLLRSVLIMPTAIAPIVAGFLFRYLYYPDGVLPQLLSWIGLQLPPQGILGSQRTAFWAVLGTEVWQWTPFVAIIVLAGLQSIPQEPYEAAQIDGATSMQTFFFVTLPMLRKTLSSVILIRLMQAINVFDVIYVQTRGGPGTSTRTLALELFHQGLDYYDIGYASALTWMIVIFSSLLINAFARIASGGEE